MSLRGGKVFCVLMSREGEPTKGGVWRAVRDDEDVVQGMTGRSFSAAPLTLTL